MAIAKNFVELMGGTIKCESTIGKGTTFTITLHMKLAEDTFETKTYEQYNDLSVLILSQEKHVCVDQINLFKELGVKADAASDALQATQMAKQTFLNKNAYHFIIINQSPDDKSGIHAVTQIAETVDTTNTLFILAANDLLAVDKSLAFDSGITAFVPTPLFKSTAVSILNKNFEYQKNNHHKEIVNLKGTKILLVEDNLINRKVACALIQETKADIYEAVNGKEAVDAFKEHKIGFFDIILMDIQMPIMNGYEATVAIRSIQRADALTIPIYAMTANTFDEDVRQVKEAGMNGHLGKPYSSEELYKILEQAIKH